MSALRRGPSGPKRTTPRRSARVNVAVSTARKTALPSSSKRCWPGKSGTSKTLRLPESARSSAKPAALDRTVRAAKNAKTASASCATESEASQVGIWAVT